MTPLPLNMVTRVARVSIVLALIGTGGCVPRQLGYPIEPGLSAAFTPTERAVSEKYARMFCSVLEAEFGSSWESCKTYLDMPSPYPAEPLDPIPAGWTLVRIGGFGAECIAKTVEAFADAGAHLEKEHGFKQKHVLVGAFDTSEKNAEQIRKAIEDLGDSKIIVVAHSKGAADMMVALTTYPDALKHVRALITVAGAVGGSYLVDGLEKLNSQLLKKLEIKLDAKLDTNCLKGLQSHPNAIDSMRRTNRQKFLAEHEHLKVPAFSISAVSTRKNTSQILQWLWDRVAPYAQEQDSHIVEREAIVPGGMFLGRALGDHWAVANPFDPNPKVSAAALRVIDKNKYPREALIEAAVRVALQYAK